MSIIKVDLNKLDNICSLIDDKTNECEHLCNQIQREYNQIKEWKGSDRQAFDTKTMQMKLLEMTTALSLLEKYPETIRKWKNKLSECQATTKSIVNRLG